MGRKVILLYIFITYVPQFFFYFLFKDAFQDRYNIETYGVFVFFVIFVYLLFFLFWGLSQSSSGLIRKRVPIGQFAFSFISIAFLLVSVLFFRNFDSSFRHTGYVSEGGIVIYLLYVLKPICLYLVLRVIFLIAQGCVIPATHRVCCFLIGWGCILSLTGSLHILGVIASFVAAFSGYSFVSQSLNPRKFAKYAFFSAVVFLLILYTGLSNKMGHESTIDLFVDSEFKIVQLVALRGSTSFVSGSVMAPISIEQPLDVEGLIGTWQTFVYRLDILLPFSLNSGQYLVAINRINYERIDRHADLKRAGASPGLVASFLYLPLFPLPMLALFFYCRVLAALIQFDAPMAAKKMPVVIAASLGFALPLFESPLSVFNVFDPVAITLIILICGRFFKVRSYE